MAAVFIVLSVLSALFAIAYLPVARRLVPAVVTPYPKADVRKRFGAAAVDAIVALTGIVFWWTVGSPVFLFASAVYIALRDALFAPGQSVGKFIFGLHVIQVRTQERCTRMRSLARNAIFLVPGLNLVAAILECAAIARDSQGQRLGDLLAETQVIDGFGAREMVGALQRERRQSLVGSRQSGVTESSVSSQFND